MVKTSKILFTLLGVLLLFFAQGQNLDSTNVPSNKGSLHINQDPRVDQLLNLYTQKYTNQEFIEGYRVQIMASSDKKTMYTTRAKFRGAFPKIKTYPTYQKPYFKLRVGGYQTKLMAQKDLAMIKKKFNGAFIVADKIKIAGLK